ncbi:NAD-binding protein [Agromyces sp. NPDC057865]|uniref:NAD-binding protein n=1 Tax=Agromyces sp. NPDC057865 TaxID=3346267 RepID=UPI00366BEB87
MIGKRVWVLGPNPRTANVVKAAVNYDIIHAMQAIGESLTLVESEGVDANEFVELLRSTLFAGIVYTSYGDLIANRRYHPAGFDISLGLKDLGLAEDIAAAAGVELPTAQALRGVFEEALADPELHDADWSAIAEITRRRLRRD